jgi:plastocyanin
MPRPIILAAFATALALSSLAPAANAEMIRDPAVHGLKRLEPLVFGVDKDSSKMAPTEYRLKVGQGYRWKIKASDLTEYAFAAPAFVRNIWIRKIEVGDPAVEIKAVTFDELEFEDGGEAEVFFVAIRPGIYEFGSKGLMERGMVGKIIVESADSTAAAPAVTKAADDDDGDDDDDDDEGDDDKS